MTAPPLPEDVASVIVVCPSWVGDTVMATAVLQAVRRLRPRTRIIAAARPGLVPLLQGASFVDEVVGLDFRGPMGPLRGARRLRALAPDAVLLLPNSFRSALTVRLAAVPIRIGHARDGRGALLTHALAPAAKRDVPVPTVEHYLRLGRFALAADELSQTLELGVTPCDDAAADRALGDVEGPFVLVTPGGNKTPKRWPVERFAGMANALAERHGVRIVASGGPNESTLVRELVAIATVPVHDLGAAGIDLGGLKAVVARAALLVTNDTGPRHIAVALGTPVVTLFGPTDHRWTLLGDVAECRLLAEPFLPSELVADRFPKMCSIERIPVSDVVHTASRFLDPPSSTAPA